MWWFFRARMRESERPIDERIAPDDAPRHPMVARLLDLQRSAGNQTVQRLLGTGTPTAGEPLTPAARQMLEARFGRDLGHVRIHADTNADQIAKQHGANAVTIGPDIYFRAGRFEPTASAGQRLLSHEIAHTIQQGEGPTASTRAGDMHEREAEAAIATGRTSLTGGAPALQRDATETAPPDATRTAADAMSLARTKITEIEAALSLGTTWSFEADADGTFSPEFGSGPISVEERNAFLRRLVDILRDLMKRLASGMPATWTLPEPLVIDGSNYHLSPELRPLGHLLAERGTTTADADLIFHYMLHTRGTRSMLPRVRVPRRPRALSLNVPLAARDPDNDPQNVRVKTGFEERLEGVVVNLWADEDGLYFYFWKGKRIYLPNFR